MLIPSVIATALMILFCPESHYKVLRKKKVARVKRDAGRNDLRSCYAAPGPVVAKFTVLLNGMLRPIKLMVLSPIVISLSIHTSFAYGTLYLFFNTISTVFRNGYGWSLGVSGLAYVPIGIGFALGLFLFARFSDGIIIKLTRKNNGTYLPEMRLAHAAFYGFFFPVSFFWYGWSADYKVHWIVPMLALIPFAVGQVGVWQRYQAYLIDAHGPLYAASALAAFAVLRSAVAAFLPLAGSPLLRAFGVGWGRSLLGFVSLAMVPILLLLQGKGAWLRSKLAFAAK